MSMPMICDIVEISPKADDFLEYDIFSIFFKKVNCRLWQF